MNSTKLVIPEWKIREKHFRDFEKCVKELGLSKTFWDGKRFWPKWHELGHSSVDFKACKCYTESKEMN